MIWAPNIAPVQQNIVPLQQHRVPVQQIRVPVQQTVVPVQQNTFFLSPACKDTRRPREIQSHTKGRLCGCRAHTSAESQTQVGTEKPWIDRPFDMHSKCIMVLRENAANAPCLACMVGVILLAHVFKRLRMLTSRLALDTFVYTSGPRAMVSGLWHKMDGPRPCMATTQKPFDLAWTDPFGNRRSSFAFSARDHLVQIASMK